MRLVIGIVWVEKPCIPYSSYQVFDRGAPRIALSGTREIEPICIRLPRCFVSPKLANKPAEDCSCRCWKEEPEGSSKGADSQVGQRRVDVALPGQLDGLQRVDKAGEYNKASDPGGALADESKDRFLHPLLWAILSVRGPNDISSESHSQMAEHDIDSGNAPETL